MHIKCHYMVCKVLMASFTFSYTSSALAVVAPIHIHIHIRRSTECLYAITEIAYVCQKSNVSTKQTYYCRCAAQHNSAQVMCVMCNDYSHARCFAHSRHSFLIQCCFSFSRREPKVEKKKQIARTTNDTEGNAACQVGCLQPTADTRIIIRFSGGLYSGGQ